MKVRASATALLMVPIGVAGVGATAGAARAAVSVTLDGAGANSVGPFYTTVFAEYQQANPAVTVNVTGFQWSWAFAYPQYGVNTDGAMWNPDETDAQNETQLPLLEIPVGETVNFNLTSPDVIHAFWVPEFLFKRDVVPGHPNHFSITATQTGTFIGHCSELCGLYHSRMLFTLKIVTPAQFQSWISQQQAIQKTASGSTQ